MYKLCKTCTKFRLKTAWNLKWMFFVHTMYKLYKMYSNVNQIIYAAAYVCLLYVQNLYVLYLSNICINNTIFHSISNLFIFKKVYRWLYMIDLFSINLIYFIDLIYHLFHLFYYLSPFLSIIFLNVFFDIFLLKFK